MAYTKADIDALYQTYYTKVYRYIQSKIYDQLTAEDLASDVFVKVYKNLDGFDETKASVSTWIYTITRNTLTDYYRTRRVSEELPEDLVAESSVEDEACREEMLERLADALAALNERERDILVLRFYKGMSLTDIADKMGISYSYIKILQTKAFEEIKKKLEK